MSVKSFISVAALAAVTSLAVSTALAQITIPTVTIGNPGNTADPTTGDLYGSVAYTYDIGTTEVTNAQYAAFLNAVAATDTYDLYDISMAGTYGGITRSGSPGSYTYATVAGRENNPVNFVSFWDACRFANWLHNGQGVGGGSGDTETGAYTLTPEGISANTITRNPDWKWAVPSVDEWYKAAYHQPASTGGDSDDYWLYPTSSNTISTSQANYDSLIGNTTPVGSYPANYFGTFDMGGNVWEWNEAILADSFRGVRGGTFILSGEVDLRAAGGFNGGPTNQTLVVGFRVSRARPNVAPDIIIDNLSEPQRAVTILGTVGPDDIWAAQGFTVPARYALESITLILGQSPAGNDPVAELRVGPLPDGPVLANLPSPPLDPLSVGPVLLTPDVPVALVAGQKYWIVLRTASTESFGWAYAAGNFWNGPGSLIEYRYSEDDGATWSSPGTVDPYLTLIRGTLVCAADVDDGTGTGTPDGGVDINDLLYFLSNFEEGAPGADLDNGTGNGIPDGGVDINDLLYFLLHFEAGC